MTTIDHRPFLAAILADPGNDAPRLVYADRLEEIGECDRAEFIRSGCARPRRTSFADNVPHRIADRGTFLSSWVIVPHWFRGATKWLNETLPPPPTTSRIDIEARRGFVERVRLPLAAWVGGPCAECSGIGARRGSPPPGADWSDPRCLACHGTGRTAAIGPLLARRCPLDRDAGVRFTDREPNRDDAYPDTPYCWFNSDADEETIRDIAHFLPPELWVGKKKRMEHTRYTSPDLAHAALSRAAIAWALAQPVPAEVPT